MSLEFLQNTGGFSLYLAASKGTCYIVPIALDIQPDRNLVVRTVTGQANVSEIRAAIEEQFADPRYRKGMHVLWDFRNAEKGTWSTAQSQQLAEFMRGQRERRGAGRFAMVADSDSIFGSAKQYQAIGHEVSPEIGVFRSMEEALEWIARPSPQDGPAT